MDASTARALLARFDLPKDKKEVLAVDPCSGGLINNSWFVTTPGGKLVLQALNTGIFADWQSVASNIAAVTAHLAAKQVPTLHFYPAKESGDQALATPEGVYRVCDFYPGKSESKVTPALFSRAGAAFATFQRGLSDFDASRLVETLPGFHDTPARIEALARLAAEKPPRLASCQQEVDFVLSKRAFAPLFTEALAARRLPLRVVHNDTKLNNVILSPAGDMVIDLDTVMPGTLLYDIGDALRAGAAALPEDPENPGENRLDDTLYEAFLRGYLSIAGATMTEQERAWIPESVAMLALELGSRFLADYLAGDVYFKTDRPDQNLNRARGQLALAADVLARLPALHEKTEACTFCAADGATECAADGLATPSIETSATPSATPSASSASAPAAETSATPSVTPSAASPAAADDLLAVLAAAGEEKSWDSFDESPAESEPAQAEKKKLPLAARLALSLLFLALAGGSLAYGIPRSSVALCVIGCLVGAIGLVALIFDR